MEDVEVEVFLLLQNVNGVDPAAEIGALSQVGIEDLDLETDETEVEIEEGRHSTEI